MSEGMGFWEEFFSCDPNQKKRNTAEDLDSYAQMLWQLFETLLKKGFTVEQAFEITKMELAHVHRKGEKGLIP